MAQVAGGFEAAQVAAQPGQLLERVRWGPDGLVPVVVRDVATGSVLMLAYMNREALAETLRRGQAVYYSRSRQSLWVKGESSGNAQELVRLWLDCDGDALLMEVRQTGQGACHTGQWSCFHRPLAGGPGDASPGPSGQEQASQQVQAPQQAQAHDAGVLARLARVIEDRDLHPKPGSYTTRLLAGGPDAVLKKVAEEAGEVLLATKQVELAREAHGGEPALQQARDALAWEAADLLYHLLVTLRWAGVAPEAVWRELARRLPPEEGGTGRGG